LQIAARRGDVPSTHCDLESDTLVAEEASNHASQESALMFDVAALAIAAACFAAVFVLRYVLEKV
jgi:hypothetical protein